MSLDEIIEILEKSVEELKEFKQLKEKIDKIKTKLDEICKVNSYLWYSENQKECDRSEWELARKILDMLEGEYKK